MLELPVTLRSWDPPTLAVGMFAELAMRNRRKKCQGRHEMCRIYMLRWITGSRARAGVLAALFREDPPRRSISELAAAASVQRSAAEREVRRLVAAGVIRPDPRSTRRQGPLYEADPEFSGRLELRRLVAVSAGVAGEIRRAILPLDPDQLAWIHGPYAEAPSCLLPIRVCAITREPHQVRDRLRAFAHEAQRRLVVDAMTLPEWTRRLERREMRVLAIRRAQRLWLLGHGERLRQREHGETSAHQTWKEAIRNWRGEYEWDEDYDPYAPVSGPG